MRIACLLAFSGLLLAQPATVAVSGPIYTPQGVVANGGTVTATLAASCVVGTMFVAKGPYTATVDSDGTLTMALVPTASCATAGNSYAVRYRVQRGGVPMTEYSETWTIPASPSTTTIAAVRSATVPSPLASVSWTQLTGIPATVSGLGSAVAVNLVNAGPSSGASAAAPTFRALVAADVPAIDTAKITSGTFVDARISQSSVTQHQAALAISGTQVSGIPTSITGTANQIAASAATGAVVLSIPTNPTLPGTTTGTFSGPLTGNAATATALNFGATGIYKFSAGVPALAIPNIDYAIPPSQPFVASAFSDTTVADNIATGTLNFARMPNNWNPAQGTISSSDPMIDGTVTWSGAGTFNNHVVNISCASCANGSTLIDLQKNGTSYLRVNMAGTAVMQGTVTSTAGGFNGAIGTCISWTTRGCVWTSTDGLTNIGINSQGTKAVFGVAAASASGGTITTNSTSVAGRVTASAGASATVTFANAFATAPACMANFESATVGNLVLAVPTTSNVVFRQFNTTLGTTTSFVGGEVFSYHCIGW